MRISLFIFIVIQLVFLNRESSAQVFTSEGDTKVEVSAMGGWLFAGRNPGAKIINAPLYSISAAYVKNPQVMYELNVNTFYSKLKYTDFQGLNDTAVQYSQTYVMFGVVRSFKTDIPNFTPYFSSSIGFLNTNIRASNSVSQTHLAAGILGGIKLDMNERFGLKFQARVQAPLSGFGLGLSIGTGGPSVGIGSYSSNVQFDLSCGVFFRL